MTEYILSGEYMDRLKARAVPGSYYSREHRAYIVEDPTPRAAAVAVKLFPHLINAAPELLALRDQLAQDVRPIDYAQEYYEGTPDLERELFARHVHARLIYEGKDFYDYQHKDLLYLNAVLQQHGAAYLGWDRGMGKTLGTCALIDELDAQRTLIVCPNTAKQAVWAEELRRWCPWLDVIVLPNEKRQRERMMEKVLWMDRHGQRFALIVHYESINIIASERANKDGWKRYGEWDLVVADEAHRIANPKAQMSRQLKRIPSRRRLALSGTVFGNHLEEMFSQLQWLFPDRYSSKWRDWNDRYLDYVDSGYAKVCVGVRIERLAELRDELGRFMVYRRKEDELDLPKRVEETRLVDLSPRQRRAYDDLATSYLAELDSGEILKATDGLVLLTRLRQIATGLDLVSGDLTDSTKQDLAVELIEDNPDEAFVVFSWYKRAADALAVRLGGIGIDSFVVTGDTPQRERADHIRRFQSGERRVFIGTISTLGESVTLHRANNAIFLDRSWNPAANQQAEDRIYRIGQERPVTITHIVAKGTVDEYNVMPALEDKQALRRMILGGPAPMVTTPRAGFSEVAA